MIKVDFSFYSPPLLRKPKPNKPANQPKKAPNKQKPQKTPNQTTTLEMFLNEILFQKVFTESKYHKPHKYSWGYSCIAIVVMWFFRKMFAFPMIS